MKSKNKRKFYTAEFKADAVKLAHIKGVSTAAKDLGIYQSQIYNWRSAAEKKANTSEREADLSAEVARLKRQLAEQAEDLAILKNVWSAPVSQVQTSFQKSFASMYPACG